MYHLISFFREMWVIMFMDGVTVIQDHCKKNHPAV